MFEKVLFSIFVGVFCQRQRIIDKKLKNKDVTIDDSLTKTKYLPLESRKDSTQKKRSYPLRKEKQT
jgi:hypothetical protein